MGGFSTPGIMGIPESGGEWKLVASVDAAKHPGQILPEFLPDGRHFLFHDLDTSQTGLFYFASVDSKSTTRVMEIPICFLGTIRASRTPRAHPLFSRDRTLLAQPFDATKGTVWPIRSFRPVAGKTSALRSRFPKPGFSSTALPPASLRLHGFLCSTAKALLCAKSLHHRRSSATSGSSATDSL